MTLSVFSLNIPYICGDLKAPLFLLRPSETTLLFEIRICIILVLVIKIGILGSCINAGNVLHTWIILCDFNISVSCLLFCLI